MCSYLYRVVLVSMRREKSYGTECWRKVRGYGNTSSRYVLYKSTRISYVQLAYPLFEARMVNNDIVNKGIQSVIYYNVIGDVYLIIYYNMSMVCLHGIMIPKTAPTIFFKYSK